MRLKKRVKRNSDGDSYEVPPSSAYLDENNRMKPGNPGRPKKSFRGPQMVRLLREILQQQDGKGRTNGYRVMEALVTKAKKGNVRSIETILNRIDGKLPDRLIQEEDPLTNEQLSEYRREIETAIDRVRRSRGS